MYATSIGSNPPSRKGDKGDDVLHDGQVKLTASIFDPLKPVCHKCLSRDHYYIEHAISPPLVVAEVVVNSLLRIFQLFAVGKAIKGDVSVLFYVSLIGKDRCNEAVGSAGLFTACHL